MNTIWSDYIQSIDTLYLSRKLRFSDVFKEKYINAFCIDGKKKILEIGCGPGALSQALARWYPDAEIIGADRDTNFIDFAKSKADNIQFIEADITNLPFEENSFDVVISNTVQEHIETSKFFTEQLRVLKSNGVCLVLSARKGINILSDCISEVGEFERNIWNITEPYFDVIDKEYSVCKYSLNECQLPLSMEKYGFKDVSTDYIAINLTPDNPQYDENMALSIINANRQANIDRINMIPIAAPNIVGDDELIKLKEIVSKKYDKRIELYKSGINQWDTNISLTMVLRGIKVNQCE